MYLQKLHVPFKSKTTFRDKNRIKQQNFSSIADSPLHTSYLNAFHNYNTRDLFKRYRINKANLRTDHLTTLFGILSRLELSKSGRDVSPSCFEC